MNTRNMFAQELGAALESRTPYSHFHMRDGSKQSFKPAAVTRFEVHQEGREPILRDDIRGIQHETPLLGTSFGQHLVSPPPMEGFGKLHECNDHAFLIDVMDSLDFVLAPCRTGCFVGGLISKVTPHTVTIGVATIPINEIVGIARRKEG